MKLTHLLIFLLVFVSCKKSNKQLVKITAKNISVDSTIIASEEITKVIHPYKEKLASKMQEVLCFSQKEIVRNDGDMQSSLGNLMADICFKTGNPIFKKKTNEDIDFVMLNYGGIRASLPKGKILKEHAFKLMPFDNELVVVKLTGEKVLELITFFLEKEKAHPLCKNIELTILKNDYILKIKGADFNKNKTYNVLTSDYLQRGGSKMNFFKKPITYTKLDYQIRDAIIDYLRKKDTIYTAIDNRIIIK